MRERGKVDSERGVKGRREGRKIGLKWGAPPKEGRTEVGGGGLYSSQYECRDSKPS